MRCTDDSPNVSESTQAEAARIPFRHRSGHVLIELPTFADAVLKQPRSGVTGPNQNEQPAPGASGTGNEWFNRVAPQVWVDRYGVDIPDGKPTDTDSDTGESCVRVRLGGRGDVAPFGVEDYDE